MNEQKLKELEYNAHLEHAYPNPNFPPSVYYRFFKLLAEYMEPNFSVELGVCGGGAGLHLALGHPEGQVIGIDIVNDYPDNIKYLNANYPNYHFIIGDSIKSAVEIYQEFDKKVDILFIDTIHTYDQTIMEYNAWRPFLSDKAVICLDDLDRPNMDKAFEHLPGKKVLLNSLHAESGFGVIY